MRKKKDSKKYFSLGFEERENLDFKINKLEEHYF
jgi:hypothetical protein